MNADWLLNASWLINKNWRVNAACEYKLACGCRLAHLSRPETWRSVLDHGLPAFISFIGPFKTQPALEAGLLASSAPSFCL
jgi:hypothetical protein